MRDSPQTYNIIDETGVCSHDVGASKTGVQLSSDISVEVDLDVNANIGDDTTPAFHQKLAVSTAPPSARPGQKSVKISLLISFFQQGISHPLFSHCFPLDTPRLSHSNSSSNASLSNPVPLSTNATSPSSDEQLASGFSVANPSGTGLASHRLLTNITNARSGRWPCPTGTGCAISSGILPSHTPIPMYGHVTKHVHYTRRPLYKMAKAGF